MDDSVSLLDLLHSVQFLPVLELVDADLVVALSSLSKQWRQCLVKSVQWGRLWATTADRYCSSPLQPIAHQYDQYWAATQTVFVADVGSDPHDLIAIHPRSTLLDLLEFLVETASDRILPLHIQYFVDERDQHVGMAITEVDGIMCCDLFKPGSQLRLSSQHLHTYYNDYVFVGRGAYRWGGRCRRRRGIAKIPTPYAPTMDLRFTSSLMRSIVGAGSRCHHRYTSFPSITSYLRSGRRWILSRDRHIYWSSTASRSMAPFEGLFQGEVILDDVVVQFERVLAASLWPSPMVNDAERTSRYIPLWNVADHDVGLGHSLPVFDSTQPDWIVIGYDHRAGHYSLSCGSVRVPTRFMALEAVLECLAAITMSRDRRRLLHVFDSTYAECGRR